MTGQDKVRERLADLDPVDYLPFDQATRLPEPPWKPTDQSLINWEAAHGHDVRMKCYPEFGCQVIGQDTARDLSSAVAALTAVLDRAEQIAQLGYGSASDYDKGGLRAVNDIYSSIAASLGVTE